LTLSIETSLDVRVTADWLGVEVAGIRL